MTSTIEDEKVTFYFLLNNLKFWDKSNGCMAFIATLRLYRVNSALTVNLLGATEINFILTRVSLGLFETFVGNKFEVWKVEGEGNILPLV